VTDVFTDVGYMGAGLTLTTSVNTGVGPATAAPEASTWAMVLTGFAALAYAACRKRSKSLRPQRLEAELVS
jgi:hypothetical protein